MDQPAAKFRLGEEVILCSKNWPDENGEAIVTNIIHGFGHEGIVPTYYGYMYQLNTTDEKFWKETALRKKHKPGDSFDSIMDSLKQPNKIKERV